MDLLAITDQFVLYHIQVQTNLWVTTDETKYKILEDYRTEILKNRELPKSYLSSFTYIGPNDTPITAEKIQLILKPTKIEISKIKTESYQENLTLKTYTFKDGKKKNSLVVLGSQRGLQYKLETYAITKNNTLTIYCPYQKGKTKEFGNFRYIEN